MGEHSEYPLRANYPVNLLASSLSNLAMEEHMFGRESWPRDPAGPSMYGSCR